MPHSTISLTPDDIDDLIYFSRTGDLPSLKESITSLAQTHNCSPDQILTLAIDVDEEGLGSGSCLLHYPSANGNLEIVQYLLSLLGSETASTPVAVTETNVTTANTTAPNPATTSDATIRTLSNTKFINHQNVSGNTALHWAGMNGHLSIVQSLVKAGADPEIVNAAGRDTVVESEWSSKEGANECAVWMLKECGGLEKGIGQEGPGTAEGEASGDVDEADMEVSAVDEERVGASRTDDATNGQNAGSH